MIEVLFRYRVHPAQVQAFEHAYGPAGPWVKLFSSGTGYQRTRLFRHKTEPFVYVTVDVWDSKPDYDRFRSEHADMYAMLDRNLHLLYLEEHLLGYYDGTHEYEGPDPDLVT
jgi:heme-degrading monooxygenase HmoA